MTTLHTVLIANRGEIALRVMRTCRRMGLRTVAVYTDLDADAPHVRAADDAVRVPSYLDVDAVVAAAVDSGADAVHPGYGFLSERAPFARALAEAGVALVGPTAEVIDLMGRKDAAREVAVAAGVPVVPSYSLDDDPATYAYPVLVKAAAGGGGKGMRVVRSAAELPEAVAAARREAATAFGDDTLLVEVYVERGRHIEVQVLGDTHGNVVHLFERDCSPQRRHQKVLEEAPGPTVDADLRSRLTTAAVDLARHVGYVGAGTVEFLVDADTGAAYFLEMNTRLQVEHPVTEAVTGVDLVELQLRVAAGEPLPLTQDDLTLTGHAIEARVYAEDAYGGFLPQAGTAVLVRWPDPGLARVDHALADGQVVSTSYDPMLGKVVVHGPDRESARRGLVAALDETAILGLTTNTGFLRELVAGPEFAAATIDTAWLDRATFTAPDPATARTIAAWTDVAVRTMTSEVPSPFRPDGWRLGADPAPVLVELDDVTLSVDRARGLVGGPDDTVEVREFRCDHHVVVLGVGGRRHQAVVNADRHTVEVVHHGHRHVFTRPDVFADDAVAAGDGTLVAPMPGTLLEVRVAEGARVGHGEVLGVLEAMKMEVALTAPFAGTVSAVGAAAGAQVALGAMLFQVDPAETQED
ncbi:acetyl/propionyl/methylcrotonyl-CoA carboxylase subunit alpha [Nocardioides ferulae]|uniref:acetyl/propionyl/methylcrotonyl-CoA carboxylase subunit alpha n=1 Tax=Nocardioides ferulae TaxID=2340821 RepID=UPI000EAE38FD|nr:biotin carboxylase N-terminal domain-containing protein [Nocardioides ferulae]